MSNIKPTKSFEEFIDLVDKTYDDHSFELRYGQTVMNVLSEIWPDKYRELIYNYLDCFYDDGMVASVLDNLKKNWMMT
jgi:hypothetical protein